MEFWIYLLIMLAPSLVESFRDPVDGWSAPSPEDLRRLDCTPTTLEGARREAGEDLDLPDTRDDRLARRAVLCRSRVMPPRLRAPRDEALLADLRGLTAGVARRVTALPDPAPQRTWLVEVFHPEIAVGQKIAFAAKAALLDAGLAVSDRAPTLAVADVVILGQTPPAEAWPLACARYQAGGGLRPTDALLALVLRHPRETTLHAAVCLDGAWRWLP